MAWYTQSLHYLWIFIAYFSWWVIPVMSLLVAKVKWGKWPIEAIILERRGDNIVKVNDRIGRRYNKQTGHTHYILQKMGDIIDVIPFETMLHCTVKPTNFPEWFVNKLRPTVGCVHLLKYGSKQYKPIKVISSDKGLMAQDENGNFIAVKEMLDAEGKTVYHQNLQPFDIRDHLGVMDFQVIDWDDVNTTLNEIENSRLRRLAKFESWAKFTVPIAIIAVVGIICVIFLYLTYDAQMQFCQSAAPATPEEPMKAPLGGDGGNQIIPSVTQINSQNT